MMIERFYRRFSKYREEYLPSIDLGYYEIYNPETVYNLKQNKEELWDLR